MNQLKGKEQQEWQRMAIVTEEGQQKGEGAGRSSSNDGRVALSSEWNSRVVDETNNFVSNIYFLSISPWTQLFFIGNLLGQR